MLVALAALVYERLANVPAGRTMRLAVGLFTFEVRLSCLQARFLSIEKLTLSGQGEDFHGRHYRFGLRDKI